MKGKAYLVLSFLLVLSFVLGSGMVVADEGKVYQEEFAYSEIRNIQVNGKFCSVNLETHKEDVVKVNIEIFEKGFKLGKELSAEHKRDGSDLNIWIEGGEGIYFGSMRGKIDLVVPENTFVDIGTASGDIKIRGINSDKIYARAVSGSVEITATDALIDIKTTSGDIYIKDSDGNKDLKAISGKVYVYDSSGDIDVETTSGDQRMKGVSGDIRADSISGKIALDETWGSLDLHTTSGDITGKYVNIDRDCFFKSVSGDIEIDFENSLDELGFDISSVSGSLTVGDIRTEKSLRIGNNGFVIKGKSTSGDQIYR